MRRLTESCVHVQGCMFFTSWFWPDAAVHADTFTTHDALQGFSCGSAWQPVLDFHSLFYRLLCLTMLIKKKLSKWKLKYLKLCIHSCSIFDDSTAIMSCVCVLRQGTTSAACLSWRRRTLLRCSRGPMRKVRVQMTYSIGLIFCHFNDHLKPMKAYGKQRHFR